MRRDAVGTLDWVFALYRQSSKFTRLSRSMRRKHATTLADRLHEALLFVEKDGVRRERSTTINHATKSCQRAWTIAFRAQPDKVPAINPFVKMGLANKWKPTPTATHAELIAFVDACDENARPSLGTAALIGWEWLQRGEDIFGTFSVEHYRPKKQPSAVRVFHEETGEEAWFPLFDEVRDASGSVVAIKALYPDLQPRLDAIKRG